jgi:hypothetical protein
MSINIISHSTMLSQNGIIGFNSVCFRDIFVAIYDWIFKNRKSNENELNLNSMSTSSGKPYGITVKIDIEESIDYHLSPLSTHSDPSEPSLSPPPPSP